MPDDMSIKTWSDTPSSWFAALVLAMINSTAVANRQVLSLLLQPIKQDLQVSDTLISLLYGFSFSVSFFVAGVPLARLADRSNRRNVIVVVALTWNLATAMAGMVRSFGGLVVARVLLGASEAGFMPSALSFLSDCFSRRGLAAAIGLLNAGVYVGGGIAMIGGGAIAASIPPGSDVSLFGIMSIKGWNVILLALGLPGFALSLLVLKLKEPARRETVPLRRTPGIGEFVSHVRSRVMAYLGIGLGYAFMILVGNGTAAWIPSLFERQFGWSIAQIGWQYGIVVLLCGSLGALTGGYVSSWFARRGGHTACAVPSLIGFVILVPTTIAFPLLGSAKTVLLLVGVMNFFAGFSLSGGMALLQDITPNRMRASASFALLIFCTIFGGMLGPTAIALVSDYLFAGEQGLPKAISFTCAVASPLSALMLWLGIRSAAKSL